jgi:hypothetical protein
VQARSLEKEATAKAVVDGQGVKAQLREEDLKTWEFDPIGKPAGTPVTERMRPCDHEADTAAMEAAVARLEAAVGADTVAQVRNTGLFREFCRSCFAVAMSRATWRLRQRAFMHAL